MATYFHTGRVHGVTHTFWTTLGDYRRQRSRHPEFPRWLIRADSLPEAEAMAAGIWGGVSFTTERLGSGRNAVFACTALIPSETVTLADGRADQGLIPGVAAVPLTARQLAQERARREARRGAAGLPCGGLWDETAQRQGSLF